MSRTKWKAILLNNSLYQNLLEKRKKGERSIDRNVKFVRDLQEKTVLLSNGLGHRIPLKVKQGMLGFCSGDFLLTRSFRKLDKKKEKP